MFVQLTGIRIFDNELIVSFGGISIFSWDDDNMNLVFGTQNYESCGRSSKILVRSAIGHQPVADSSRRHYDHIKPHVALGYKPPAPEVFAPAIAARPAAPRQTAPPATLAPKPALN